MKSLQAGYSLVEALVVVMLLTVGTVMYAKALVGKAKKKADIEGVKSLLITASSRSVGESRHFGVHFDSVSHSAGYFQDENRNDVFDGMDTLIGLVKLSPLSTISIVDSDSASANDICFKKNGAVASETSYEITYKGPAGDTARLQIIAASGRIMNP